MAAEMDAQDNAMIALISWLENKYNSKRFIPIVLYQEESFIDFRAYPEGGSRDNDVVKVICEQRDGEVVFCDNYFFECIKEEYDLYMKNLLKEYFTSFKVFYDNNVYYGQIDLKVGDTWDYIRKNDIDLEVDIDVFVDDEMTPDEFQEKYTKLITKLYYENVNGGITVYHVHKECFDDICETNRHSFLTSKEWFQRIIEYKQKVISYKELLEA